MEIKIFDVEHGNCTLIKTPNGRHILIDCGHNSTTGFRPSDYLLANSINKLDFLIISNLDQDHISDLPNIYKKLSPSILSRNKQIDGAYLNENKEFITDEMDHYIEMHENYNSPIDLDQVDFGGVKIFHFNHTADKFTDTNNLSLVTFVQYNDLNIIFPGDLEKQAWEEFLKNGEFVDKLKETNIFVASHHGRENGYCPEIFFHCKPEIILISDENIKYDTQKDIGYSNHSSGIQFNGNNKYVLTTRNHGMISINASVVYGNTIGFENN